MRDRTWGLLIATAAVVVAVVAIVAGTLQADAHHDIYRDDRTIAAEAGLTLGPVPDEGGELDELPDLVPVVDAAGTPLGYAYPNQIFANAYDPNVEVIAYGVYQPDGETLIGHVVSGRGFVEGDAPMVLTQPAPIPEPLE